MERVAEKAGRAAPAVALAGVLVGVPHGHFDAAAPAGKPAAVTAFVHKGVNTQQGANGPYAATGRDTANGKPAANGEQAANAKPASNGKPAANGGQAANGRHAAPARRATAERSYDVHSGDTLSGIARRYYHNAEDWQWLYHVNNTSISDPDLIYPGERLRLPSDPPADYTLNGYAPRHASQTATDRGSGGYDRSAANGSQSTSGSSSASGQAAGTGSSRGTGLAGTGSSRGAGGLAGTLSCGALELLWRQAGGSSSEAVTAASIAMAESGGSQFATNGSSGTRGYWQISPSWGAMSTYSPMGNAEAAVKISANGADWNPWTTYTSGAYSGRC